MVQPLWFPIDHTHTRTHTAPGDLHVYHQKHFSVFSALQVGRLVHAELEESCYRSTYLSFNLVYLHLFITECMELVITSYSYLSNFFENRVVLLSAFT